MTGSSNHNARDPFLEPPWLTVAPDRPLLAEAAGTDAFDLGLRIGPIYDILRHPKTETPMAAAIYGDWGAGKTSAMRWLEGRLKIWNDEGAADDKVKVHTAWFYPWKYQTQEDVWRGLVAQVIIACLDTKNADAKAYIEAAKDLGAFLGSSFIDLVSSVKFSVAVPGAAKADIDLKSLKEIKENAKTFVRPESAYLNEFESAFETWVGKRLGRNERMVVFIDDLDRCMPEVGLRVLEALKLYLNVKGLIFVVGVDREVVNDIVKRHYETLGLPEEKSANYLGKMFQVEATVAPSDPQIDAYLHSTLSVNPAWQQFEASERNIFRDVIRELAAASPREVKRLVNSALMAGAGARMSATALRADAEPITPAQGTQVFLVRKVLETPKYTLGSLVGRNLGTDFFTAWSEVVRSGDTQLTIHLSEEFVKGIRAHYEDRRRPDREQDWDERAQDESLRNMLTPYPQAYRALLGNPSFADLLHLLGDESLGALMLLPYPKEAAVIGGLEADTTSAGLIREAIARALSIRINEVTPAVFDRVTELDLPSTEITELEPLKGLTNLQKLILKNTRVIDLEPLRGLARLQRLDLDHTQVTDLEPLRGLTSLERLDFDHTQVTDLEPLKGLTTLEWLGLNGTQVTDFEPLEGLTSLRVLFLHGTQIADLELLKGLTNLRSLFLDRTQVTDLGPLTGLTSIRTLYLRGTPVTDVEPLKGLRSLQELSLKETQVAELEPLRGLTGLQKLELDGTQVTDLEPLKGLMNLEDLSLKETQVTDLEPLRGLTSLQRLELDGTQVTDLEPLWGLASLKSLSIRQTRVSDDAVLRLETSLPNLEIHQ